MFILCVEVLAIKVRNSRELQGLQFGYQKPVKLALKRAGDGILLVKTKWS